jgi:stringent starvation protein B
MMPNTLRSYIIQAVYRWCIDNGHTPYLAVAHDYSGVVVPQGYDTDGVIILDTSFQATKNLVIEDDYITFSAKFGGKSQNIYIPIKAVMSIFAKETSQGVNLSFELPLEHTAQQVEQLKPVRQKPKLTVVQRPKLTVVRNDPETQ